LRVPTRTRTVRPTARARAQIGTTLDGEPIYEGLAPHFADRWGLISTIVAVPIFAFFSAGVSIGGIDGLTASLTDTIALGIIAGLVLGKPLGILSVTYLLIRSRSLSIDPSLRWIDPIGMSFVAGIGFTVSLLVGELSYGPASEIAEHVKVGVLLRSLTAAILGGLILSSRNRRYRAGSQQDRAVNAPAGTEPSAS
jgi:Na+:H+ antiporter, NhaA family